MPYTFSWDETDPLGSAQANTLETIIQNKMKQLRERLTDFVPEWTNDAINPKRIKVLSGTAANRPAPAGLADGIIYYSTDTNKLEIVDGAAWVQLSPLDTSLLPTGVVRVVGRQNVDQQVTGTTTETVLATITIPANLMGPNGWVRVVLVPNFSGVGGIKTVKLKHGGNTLVTGNVAATDTGQGLWEILIWNKNATNSQYATGFAMYELTGGTSFKVPLDILANIVDTTLAQDIVITGTLVNAGDTIALLGIFVEVMPS